MGFVFVAQDVIAKSRLKKIIYQVFLSDSTFISIDLLLTRFTTALAQLQSFASFFFSAFTKDDLILYPDLNREYTADVFKNVLTLKRKRTSNSNAASTNTPKAKNLWLVLDANRKSDVLSKFTRHDGWTNKKYFFFKKIIKTIRLRTKKILWIWIQLGLKNLLRF